MTHVYGLTETSVTSTVYPLAEKQAADERRTLLPLGRPIANTELYVLDEAMQPVPRGVIGELYLGGAGVGRGYWRQPGQTAARFVPHPFTEEPGARLYKTGDLVRYQADGNLIFEGRRDTQVKVRGYRIELGEVESVLERHEQVSQAVALVRRTRPGARGWWHMWWQTTATRERRRAS